MHGATTKISLTLFISRIKVYYNSGNTNKWIILQSAHSFYYSSPTCFGIIVIFRDLTLKTSLKHTTTNNSQLTPITNWKVVQSKHNNVSNNVKFATCFGYSNHHQADISVHGHDMFSAFSMGSHIVYICCVEFKTLRLINCSVFNILTNVFSEIIYELIDLHW